MMRRLRHFPETPAKTMGPQVTLAAGLTGPKQAPNCLEAALEAPCRTELVKRSLT